MLVKHNIRRIRHGKAMEIDVVAESFGRKMLLFGEAKWEENSSIKIMFEKLDYHIGNFPQLNNRKVLTSGLVEKHHNGSLNQNIIVTPEDILQAMK
jgi:hypothetical protein